MKFREIIDKKQWNEFVYKNVDTDILQSWEWGELKKIEGWKPFRFAVYGFDSIILGGQVLLKKVPIFGNLAYIPHGPAFNCRFQASFNEGLSNEQIWKMFENGLVAWAKKNNVFTIEIEPKIYDNMPDCLYKMIFDERRTKNEGCWLRTGRNRQAKHKLFLDIARSDEEILAGMKKNTRYNIKQADKYKVKIKKYKFDDPEIKGVLDRFYGLLLDMQKRAGGYPVRSRKYFEKLVEIFKNTDRMMFIEASVEGEVVAINISQFTDVWASSFYAGSNRLHPKSQASYLLRWESILEAKKRGCKVYDFWGVILDSKQHAGYSQTKMSFGGTQIDEVGILEYRIKPVAILWPLILKLRSILHI